MCRQSTLAGHVCPGQGERQARLVMASIDLGQDVESTATHTERVYSSAQATMASPPRFAIAHDMRDFAIAPDMRFAIAHDMTDKVHVVNSWQSSRTRPVLMLLVLCMSRM